MTIIFTLLFLATSGHIQSRYLEFKSGSIPL